MHRPAPPLTAAVVAAENLGDQRAQIAAFCNEMSVRAVAAPDVVVPGKCRTYASRDSFLTDIEVTRCPNLPGFYCHGDALFSNPDAHHVLVHAASHFQHDLVHASSRTHGATLAIERGAVLRTQKLNIAGSKHPPDSAQIFA